MSKRKPGRPVGSKAAPVDVVVTQPPSVCRRCGSARRAAYWNPRTHEAGGVKTTWRRTRCLACGQVRDDKTIERPARGPSPLAPLLDHLVDQHSLAERIGPDELIPPPEPSEALQDIAGTAECDLTNEVPPGSPEDAPPESPEPM